MSLVVNEYLLDQAREKLIDLYENRVNADPEGLIYLLELLDANLVAVGNNWHENYVKTKPKKKPKKGGK